MTGQRRNKQGEETPRLYLNKRIYSSCYVATDGSKKFYCNSRTKHKCTGQVGFDEKTQCFKIGAAHVEACPEVPPENVEFETFKVGFIIDEIYLYLRRRFIL